MTSETVQPGWYPDPSQQFEQRYWDGATWTDHVFADGAQSVATMARSRAEARALAAQSEAETRAEHNAAAEAVAKVSAPAPAGTQNALIRENIPLVGARKHAEKLRSEVARLQGLIDQYGLQEVAALDDLKRHLNQEVDGVRGQVAAASAELASRQADIASTQASLLDLRGAVEVQELGLYDYEHPAEDSVALATQLEALRADIKTAVRAGRATQATSNFTFNNSTAKGAKFVRDMSKLMLRSYNAEAENCVKAAAPGTWPPPRSDSPRRRSRSLASAR